MLKINLKILGNLYKKKMPHKEIAKKLKCTVNQIHYYLNAYIKHKYGCIELNCNNIVSEKGVRCKHCSHQGKRGSNYIDGRTHRKVYCIDCGNRISRHKYKRCHKCEGQRRHTLGIGKRKARLTDKEREAKSIAMKKVWKSSKFRAKMKKRYNICSKGKCYEEIYGIKRAKEIRTKISKNHGTRYPEVRAKISENHADFSGIRNPIYGKLPLHGKKSKYKGIWMRSSWEVKYAKYLDKNKIKWQYEPKTFDLGDMTYTPDFYLPEQNKYIEIKGWWRDNSKRKFNLFKKVYSQIKIEILQKMALKNLGIKT